MICLLFLLNVLTYLNREISGGPYTIHTKVLLVLLIICIINVLFSYKTWHNLTKISLIVFPSLIIVFLPLFYGNVQESDFIDAPITIMGFSFVPQLILNPKLKNKLYLTSFLYFLLLVSFLDNILVHFSPQKYSIVTSTDDFHFFYKLVFIAVFLFIQSTMYYLRNLNYTYEAELIFTNEKLKLTVEELKTTQQHLIQSEKLASLGTLASGVAHEINNPLNFIQGGIAFIENYIKDNFPERLEEVQPVINGINTGVKRTADIVKSLSHYNRSDTLPLSICNLHEIIDDCLIMLRNQYKNRIEVLKQYTVKQHTILGKEGKLHQAFLNVLANACQAIKDKGSISIITNLINDEFQITITDSGQGISKENIKKIFDPFFTTKDPGRGIGLGLSITYNIIEEHKGTIEFESQIEEGTKVTIKLPLETKQL